MIVTSKDKENIARLVKGRKVQFGMSLEAVARKVTVNKSTVNKLVHEGERWKQGSVSDEMWMKFADWVGYSLDEGAWKIDRQATNFKRYYNMCKHAQEDGIMRIISDRFGKGKSTALQTYVRDHETTSIYLKCHKSWTQRVLLAQIKKALNLSGGVQSTFSALEEIVEYVIENRHLKLMMAFDEYNRLPEGSKAQIFSLYEMTEFEMGLILCGGENLEKQLKSGVDRAKQDCQEIFDRGGFKFLKSKPLSNDQMTADIIRVCELNEVTDKMVISSIINNFSGSFRKVKADIDDYKKRQRKPRARMRKPQAVRKEATNG